MRKILSNKIYLYLTEFFSGMSVMAVELGASRLLAPYFSSSQIVWTIIIGTIMIAMALGNIYGGRSADKNPNPDRLYARIILAAAWIALIPVVGKYIVIGISALVLFTVNTSYLVWAAFAACMVIFVFPLFLLGTVTPSLAKYTVRDLDDSGRTVGMLNASNTTGSIIGTFLPTFVTIPAVGTSITFLIFAGILMVLAVIYFASGRVKSKAAAAGVIILVVSCIFGHSDSFAFWEDDLTYEGESIYNYLQVKDSPEQTALSTNVLFGVQSVYQKSDSLTGMYYDYAMAAPLMAGVNERDHLDMLILGMGTGTYATQCGRCFGSHTDLDITGVEIDEKITKLAHRCFHLSKDVPVYTYDGRAFLAGSKKKYDVIMVDAYQDITIPFQMSSVEFFSLVQNHLNPDGVMVVNMNMKNEAKGSGEDAVSINEALANTIAAVFPQIVTIDVDGMTNRELFASQSPDMMDTFEQNLDLEQDRNTELYDFFTDVSGAFTPYEAGSYTMTDDKAPVELLGMQAMDALIGDELGYYKDIYHEEGLGGLIRELE